MGSTGEFQPDLPAERHALAAPPIEPTEFALRLAQARDVPAIALLIGISVRALQARHYSSAQMDAALGPVFGIDRELIRDGTYFVAEHNGELIGCGGWSRRQSLFGSDAGRTAEQSALLDPAHDPARIRAFFVHPRWARRGIGRLILDACERAMAQAQFRSAELVATLTGEPLYAAASYTVVKRYDIPLEGGLGLAVARMVKTL